MSIVALWGSAVGIGLEGWMFSLDVTLDISFDYDNLKSPVEEYITSQPRKYIVFPSFFGVLELNMVLEVTSVGIGRCGYQGIVNGD